MLFRVIRTFWGDFSKDELSKFLYLALGAFLLIGAQWPGKLLKDGLLVGEIGANLQPILKILSIVVCFPLTLGYVILVNHWKRENVIYSIIGFLASLGIVFFVFLSMLYSNFMPEISSWLLNSTVALPTIKLKTLSYKFVHLSIGWASCTVKDIVISGFYLYSEMFTALTIPAFWAFVNDMTTPEEAKRGYGLIVFGAQFGGLVTTYIAELMSSQTNNSPIISLMSTGLLVALGFCIWLLTHKVKRKTLKGYDETHVKKVEEKHKIPFLSGLFLIGASPYVAGIMFLTAFQEIMTAIMTFTLLKTAGASLASKAAIYKIHI